MEPSPSNISDKLARPRARAASDPLTMSAIYAKFLWYGKLVPLFLFPKYLNLPLVFLVLLTGFEPSTFGSPIQRSNHWALGHCNCKYFQCQTLLMRVRGLLYNTFNDLDLSHRGVKQMEKISIYCLNYAFWDQTWKKKLMWNILWFRKLYSR